ncbi:hypothetical protein AMECASPLE_029937 [Ameca splendens]|uniref:Uncharacterized protein n=1 Tax=Ameca splendens TaxID=208324 RepID=A0ABV0Z452_9TELE
MESGKVSTLAWPWRKMAREQHSGNRGTLKGAEFKLEIFQKSGNNKARRTGGTTKVDTQPSTDLKPPPFKLQDEPCTPGVRERSCTVHPPNEPARRKSNKTRLHSLKLDKMCVHIVSKSASFGS